MFKSLKYIIISVILFHVFYSCEKEEFYNSIDANLKFSSDTVLFDTIFTTVGSSTQMLKVKNPYNKIIKISSIGLAGGETSPFRLNIDGYAGVRLQDIELREKDSLYIFVEITIDPTNSNLPLVVKDSIIFSFNDKEQDIKLIAFGQDVHKYGHEVIGSETWINDKPYLIYDTLVVDVNSTLTIEPGAILHFHKNSRLFVAGTIEANGTFDSPIVFQSDRLEDEYENIPGQWDGIWLMSGSKNNVFNYAEIKNAIIGIQVDTFANEINPTLLISNSRIENMTSTAIYAQGSTIKAYNNIISNCGQFGVALTIGGSYEFYHCTIGNYWGFSARSTSSLLINNYYIDINGTMHTRPLTKALFGNCIIYGNKTSEVYIDLHDNTELNYKFDHTLIKVDSDFSTSDPNHFENVITEYSPNFIDPYEGNFELDTLSAAKDFGKDEYGDLYRLDINLQNRTSDSGPDLGAFERVETP
ncbi:MAG: hypothetical protein GQ564_21585 [Bacteroidales bacterium]|nr:hypothetical protein [Bacteroidales bacterium]